MIHVEGGCNCKKVALTCPGWWFGAPGLEGTLGTLILCVFPVATLYFTAAHQRPGNRVTVPLGF